MKINKTNEFIEVIGHYDNEVQCAKMTLLAELYAIEHCEGYAKFPIECEDKLGLVDKKLGFPIPPQPEILWGPFYNYFILNGITKTVQASIGRPMDTVVGHLYITYHNNNIYGIGDYISDDIPTTEYILTNGELILENVNPEYTGGFFENPHGSGTDDDPYYLVEDEVVDAGWFADFTTYHTEKQSPKVSIDLTTFSGWSSLSDGTHSITVKAKATGYRDSEASQAVSVTKAPSGETWVINETLSNVGRHTFTIAFSSNNNSFNTLSTRYLGGGQSADIKYDDTNVWNYSGITEIGTWINQAYRTVTFETAPTGDLLTWLQSNAVKQ